MHSFDPEIAKLVGVNAAVIYQNIVWWTEKNAANERHFHEGRYWTYNSLAAFEELFPYLTVSQIRTALSKLESEELIMTGTFNKSGYDRTKWYCPTSQSHLSKVANGFSKNRAPIPDIKPVISENTDVFSLCASEEIYDFFEDFWDQYPHRNGAKKGKTAARKSWGRAIKKADPSQIIQGAMRYATDAQVLRGYAKDPATWLNQQCWEDDVEREQRPSVGAGSGSSGGMVAAFAAVAARRAGH